MVKEFRYEFIVDGVIVDRITVETREELKKCIDILEKWEDKTA